MRRMLLATMFCAALALAQDGRCAPAKPSGPLFGETVNGIRVSVEVTPADWRPNTKLEFACTVLNTTNMPVRVASWGLDLGQALDIRNEEGQAVQCESSRDATARVPRSAIITLAAKESHRFTLRARVNRGSVLIVDELLGGMWQYPLPAGDLSVRAVFARAENDPWAKRLARGGYWTGKAVSPIARVSMTNVALEPGEEVNDLTLKLRTETTDVRMVRADGADRWRVEPVKLEVSFVSGSREPMKVNTRDLFARLVALDVDGPDEDSVRVTRAEAPKGRDDAAEAAVTIDPDTGWTSDFLPLFPGRIGGTTYELLKPGAYRITAIYSSSAEGFWTGAVRSNEITLNVLGGPTVPGSPVKGLKIQLAAEPDEITVGGEPAKLAITFVNVSAEPIKVNTYELDWQHLSLDAVGPDGARLVPKDITPLVKRTVLPPGPDDYPVIAPGKSWSYKWKPRFPGELGPLSFALAKPGEYRLKVTYRNDPLPAAEEFQDFIKGSWTGDAASNEITVNVLPAK